MTTFVDEYKKFKTPKEIIKEALIAELHRCLALCTEEQQKFFERVFPEGIAGLKQDKLESAIDLCHRTLAKNAVERKE